MAIAAWILTVAVAMGTWAPLLVLTFKGAIGGEHARLQLIESGAAARTPAPVAERATRHRMLSSRGRL